MFMGAVMPAVPLRRHDSFSCTAGLTLFLSLVTFKSRHDSAPIINMTQLNGRGRILAGVISAPTVMSLFIDLH